MHNDTFTSAHDVLKQYWGHHSFKPLQEEIIQSILGGQELLTILPTGGGKSLCYQIPAVLRNGTTIVISPLIALMNDQVHQLQKKGIPAVSIHSGLNWRSIDRILDNARYDHYRLLYISPERLENEAFIHRLTDFNVNMVAVDEAHCIAQWGHDFRPAYLRISKLRDLLPDVQITAFTATATKRVEKEIVEQLELKSPKIYRSSVCRSELAYRVELVQDKMSEVLKHCLSRPDQHTIIYTRSRKSTEQIALYLNRRGLKSIYYHAGLPNAERNAREQSFVKGEANIIVATTAFGMGIDKSNVRQVLHVDLPGSLEEYIQEAGRAGRDGRRSDVVLFYQNRDWEQVAIRYQQAYPDIWQIRKVYDSLGNYLRLAVGSGKWQEFQIDIQSFTEQYNYPAGIVMGCLNVLQQSGWLLFHEKSHAMSTLRFAIDYQDLYAFQQRQPVYEPIIRTILRLYDGIINHTSDIREGKISQSLQVGRKQVIQMLTELDQRSIVKYRKSADQSSIYFLHERVPAKNLTIDHSWLEQRKTVAKSKMTGIRDYVNATECRQKTIASYFGEQAVENCGVCDRCAKKDSEVDLTLLTDQIVDLLRLQQGRLSFEALYDNLKEFDKVDIHMALQQLTDQGICQLHLAEIVLHA